jgi:UDP-N-acetylglucosamine 1-carboxyvinyltransferase
MKTITNKKFIIKGPSNIQGEIEIAGAKNSALPILAASVLCTDGIILHNIPKLSDIISMLESISYLGCNICLHDNDAIAVDANKCKEKPIYAQLTKKTRASILLLGPLLARFGKATLALPGGCDFGQRPIDIHLSGLESLGATIEINDGVISASAPNGLKGCEIHLKKPSVGATENLIMAATLADGETTIFNIAKEPEIDDLISLLKKMGAPIHRQQPDVVTIKGSRKLTSCEHTIIGDRLEAGTYLIAAAATQGNITTKKVNPKHLDCVLEKLKDCGANISTTDDSITLQMNRRPRAVGVTTMPYPGFPTDLQALWLALNAIAEGSCEVIDTIYEKRMSHVSELEQLGAQLQQKHNTIRVVGAEKLIGGNVHATDIRASAGLIIAGLSASGETHIHNTDYIDRGYVALEEKLRKMGAKIHRTHE